MAQAYLDFEIEKKEKESQKVEKIQDINQAIEDLLGSQLDPNIFLDDNDNKIGKEEIKTKPVAKKRKYSATKVKTRNILTNLSYIRVNRLDFDNKSYVLDILTFIIQYLNSFLLDLKLETDLEKNMLMFVWQNCLPTKLTNFVSTKDNYDTLTKNNLKFKDVYLIVQEYMSSGSDDGENNEKYNEVEKMLKSNFDEIRYVFSNLFPKIYSRTNESGRQIKSKFDYSFSLWFNDYYSNNIKQQQQQQQQEQQVVTVVNRGASTGKNMDDYKNRVFINEFEQKPLKNELIDVINTLDNVNISKNDAGSLKSNDLIEVKKEEEINSFVKVKKQPPVAPRVAPINDVKKKFLNDREKRKHAKLMEKKRRLEEQLKKNTEQWNLLKPVFKANEKNSKKLIKNK